MRVKIVLACTECKQRNYTTMKNKKNDPDRLEMKKYCSFCRKHTLHKATKKGKEEVLTVANENTAKKPSLLSRVKRFFKDIRGELKKVAWPTKKQVINNTTVVIVVVIISSIGISLIDYFFGLIIRLFFGS